jgi:hypothetical protein
MLECLELSARESLLSASITVIGIEELCSEFQLKERRAPSSPEEKGLGCRGFHCKTSMRNLLVFADAVMG